MKKVKIYNGEISESENIDFVFFDETIRNLKNSDVILIDSINEYHQICSTDVNNLAYADKRINYVLAKVWPGKDLTFDHYSLKNIKTVQNVAHCYSVKSLITQADHNLKQITLERESNRQLDEFVTLAKKRHIGFDDLDGCIDSIQIGTRMTDKERIACDLLGEPNTFWNPVKHLDYNWFLDHRHEIENAL